MAPTSLARIRLGEHTVLWQRSGQAPMRPTAGYGAAAASPAPTQSALVDYPDTIPREAVSADEARDRDYDVPLDEVPSAPQSGHDDGSTGEPPEWMLQHGSPEEQRHAMPRTDGDCASPPREGRATSASAVQDPSADAEMPQAPKPQTEAAAEPAAEPELEPPQAADSEQHQSDALQQTAAEEQLTVGDKRADHMETTDDSDGRAEPGSSALPADAPADGSKPGPSQMQEQLPREPNGEAAQRHKDVPEASKEDRAERPAKRCACETSLPQTKHQLHPLSSVMLGPSCASPESVRDDCCQLQDVRAELDTLPLRPLPDNGV
jgi:hypothetical protein